MTELTGAVSLARCILRRDRLRMLVWTVSIVLLELLTAASTKGLYPTQADLDQAAAAVRGNAAAIALNGPDQALDTMGGQVAFQIGTIGLVAVALMAIFMVGRATRLEEETGRMELVRAMPVGRHAAIAAAMTMVTGMSAVVGAAVSFGLVSLNLPVEGSVLFGVALFAEGLVFAGITVVCAQLTDNTRVVLGSAGAVLAAAFVLRVAGDIGDGTLSWFSPIGWSQKTRPFAGEQWWPLLIPAVFVLGLTAVGGVLSTRRDLDAGFIPPRPGSRAATPGLGRPLGLALRLQRGSLIGWSVGLFLMGAAFGWVADDVDALVGDNENLREMIAQLGGVTLTDAYLTSELMLTALAAAGFAIQAALRLRVEETALRAEPLLATPTSRRTWMTSHLVIALAGSVIVLASGGLGSGLLYGIASGDLGQIPRTLGAALAYAPALWLFVGLAALLFGLLPRAVAIAWAALTACVIIGLLGEVFNFPAWVDNTSPFQHTPQLPAQTLSIVPLTILTAIAAALTAAGLVAFRHRDIAGANIA
jgi:ABC-2 type transport system permease protein